jgi:hypothetical protein
VALEHAQAQDVPVRIGDGHAALDAHILHVRRGDELVLYRVVVYCDACVTGTTGSLIASEQTVRTRRRSR